MDTELEQRLEALEQRGLGASLTGRQIAGFTLGCLVLPIVIAVLGRGLLA